MTSTEPLATVDTQQPTASTEIHNTESVSLSLFFADALRIKKDKEQAGFQQQNKPNHHKTPNRPPHGTRRSMGKR
jgi:hypothetical protein